MHESYRGAQSFRVPTQVLIAKFALAATLALAALFVWHPTERVLAVIAAVMAGGYGLRDVLVRERLRADAEGLLAVHGFAARRRLPWAEIDRIIVDSRNRLGGRVELLEVDTGDEIFLFSRYDLGMHPDEALAAIETVRPH